MGKGGENQRRKKRGGEKIRKWRRKGGGRLRNKGNGEGTG